MGRNGNSVTLASSPGRASTARKTSSSRPRWNRPAQVRNTLDQPSRAVSSPLKLSGWYPAANAPNPNRPSSTPGASGTWACRVSTHQVEMFPLLRSLLLSSFVPPTSDQRSWGLPGVVSLVLQRLRSAAFVRSHPSLAGSRAQLVHDFGLTTQTQTNQERTTRSSAPVDEFSWVSLLEARWPCSFNALATVLKQPSLRYHAKWIWPWTPFFSRFWKRL